MANILVFENKFSNKQIKDFINKYQLIRYTHQKNVYYSENYEIDFFEIGKDISMYIYDNIELEKEIKKYFYSLKPSIKYELKNIIVYIYNKIIIIFGLFFFWLTVLCLLCNGNIIIKNDIIDYIINMFF